MSAASPPKAGLAWAFLVFSLASVALTWPVAAHMGDALAGDGADANVFLWNGWWMGQAISHGQDPFYTHAMFWPLGSSLVLHTLSPLLALVQAILGWPFGPIAAYNVVFLASFALAAWCAYALAFDVVRSRPASYVAGFAYGFLPFHYAHALGHLNVVSYFWIPLYILLLRKLIRAPSWRLGALTTLCIVGAGLTDYPFLLMLALAGGAWILASGAFRERRAWIALAGPGAAAAILLSPLFVAVTLAYRARPDLLNYQHDIAWLSLDALSYLTPTPITTLYAGSGHVLVPGGTPTEGTVFLGYLIALLAVGGVLVSTRRQWLPWLLFLAPFWILSLGPELRIGGIATGIPLPYAAIERLPLLDALRTPARFAMVVSLGVAMLAALAVASLDIKPWRMRRAFVAAICLVVLAESVWIPFPDTRVVVSPAYAEAAKAAPAAIVDLPLMEVGYGPHVGRVQYVAAQTIHGMPIVNGNNARETSIDLQFMHGEVVLGMLSRLEIEGPNATRQDIFPDQDTQANSGGLLAAWNLTRLVLHHNADASDAERLESGLLPNLTGIREIARYPDATLYGAEPAANTTLLLDLRAGWHDLGPWDGVPFRWAHQSAEIVIRSPCACEANLTATFRPFLAHESERHLIVSLEARDIGSLILPGDWVTGAFALTLHPGENVVTLRTLEPEMSPRQLGIGADTRGLAFGAKDVRVQIRS